MADRTLILQINEARRLYALHGETIRRDDRAGFLLDCYGGAIGRTGELMRESGVVNACAECARNGAGSCCFQGIEDGYDEVLLLINLLLGCEVPAAREIAGSCFFVGENGCKLPARYYFCLNYFCPDLQWVLGVSGIKDLAATVGYELSTGWTLERTIRRWLNSR